MLARAAAEDDESGAFGLSTIFDIGKTIVNGAEALFGGK